VLGDGPNVVVVIVSDFALALVLAFALGASNAPTIPTMPTTSAAVLIRETNSSLRFIRHPRCRAGYHGGQVLIEA